MSPYATPHWRRPASSSSSLTATDAVLCAPPPKCTQTVYICFCLSVSPRTRTCPRSVTRPHRVRSTKRFTSRSSNSKQFHTRRSHQRHCQRETERLTANDRFSTAIKTVYEVLIAANSDDLNPLESWGNIVPHQAIWSWYTGRWWVGCYIWHSDERTGRGHSCRRHEWYDTWMTTMKYGSFMAHCKYYRYWLTNPLIVRVSID